MEQQTTVVLTLAEELYNKACTVFSGEGPVSDWHRVADAECSKLVRRFDKLVSLRKELAMSGAMRWPWSSEAPIYDRQGFEI